MTNAERFGYPFLQELRRIRRQPGGDGHRGTRGVKPGTTTAIGRAVSKNVELVFEPAGDDDVLPDQFKLDVKVDGRNSETFDNGTAQAADNNVARSRGHEVTTVAVPDLAAAFID